MEACPPALNDNPPDWLERLVLLLIPPVAREAVGGDLCETYRSPLQYALQAARTLPFVIASQMRRRANLPVMALQGALAFVFFGGLFSGASGAPGWLHAGAVTAGLLLLLLLLDTYRGPSRPSPRWAFFEATLMALMLQAVIVLVRHANAHLFAQDPLVALVPVAAPLLGLFRAGVMLGGDRSWSHWADTASPQDIIRDHAGFARRVGRRNAIETGALMLALCVLLLHGAQLHAMGALLFVAGALAAIYLLLNGAARPLQAGADFLTLRAQYRHELRRQHRLRHFTGWLLLTPLFLAVYVGLVGRGFAAGQLLPVVLGSAAAMLLCFFVGAFNREFCGGVQERVGLLDRMQEKSEQAEIRDCGAFYTRF